MELQEIKDIAVIAKPFVEPIISTIIKPQIDKLKSWLKKEDLNNKVIDNYFENKFEEYLYRTFYNCSNLNVLVFPNQQIQIKDLYLPLKITSSKQQESYKIDVLKNLLFQNIKKY